MTSYDPQEFPIQGEETGIASVTGRWHGPDDRYVVACPRCRYQSKPQTYRRALVTVRRHVESRAHWMHRSDIQLPRKRPTVVQLQELWDQDRHHAQRILRQVGPDYDRLDREAIAAGYDRGGSQRPWYRRHLRELALRSGDREIMALLDRLDEIEEAKKEERALRDMLREWEDTITLVDRQHIRRS